MFPLSKPWAIIVLSVALLAAGAGFYLLRPHGMPHPSRAERSTPERPRFFRDMAREAGITFRMQFLPSEQGEKFKINLYDHGCGVAVGIMTATASTTSPAPAEVTPAAAKRFTFELRGTSWNKVLEWLADQSGLAVSTDLKPTGTLTFITPATRKDGYTLPEIIDLLNEALASQNYLLIRRSQSFAVIGVSLTPGSGDKVTM
jgi:hypothetical protein